jgi:hypothetical protein
MSLAIYVGKNPPGTGMYTVAEDIKACVGGDIIDTISKLAGHDTVINLTVGDERRIMELRRFTGIRKIITLLACNFEELSPSEAATLLLHLEEGTDLLVVHSQHSLDQITSFAKKTLSYPLAQKVLEQVRLVWWAIGDFQLVNDTSKDPLHWVVPYNRFNQTQKDLNLHHEVTSRLQLIASQHGRMLHTDFIYGGLKSDVPAKFTAYGYVPQGPRAQYESRIAKYGAFLCTSKFESFGIYYLELLSKGAVGVFADYPWVRKLLPGYPFIVEKKRLVEACWNVVENYERCYHEAEKAFTTLLDTRYNYERLQKDLKELL